MQNELEYQQQRQVMVRSISIDNRRAYEDVMHRLHDDEYHGTGNYQESCEEFGSIIIPDFLRPSKTPKYLRKIEMARMRKIDLWDNELWKRAMRLVIPEEYQLKAQDFTLVPRLSAMSPAPKQRVQTNTVRSWLE